MNQQYTTSFTVDQTPEEAFDAINNVRGWWSQAIEGDTDKLGAEFEFHSGDVHRSTQTITVTRVEYLTGTIAIVDQNAALTGYAFLPPNGLKPTEPGVVRTIVRGVVEKRGGTWEIIAQQMTLVPPAS